MEILVEKRAKRGGRARGKTLGLSRVLKIAATTAGLDSSINKLLDFVAQDLVIPRCTKMVK